MSFQPSVLETTETTTVAPASNPATEQADLKRKSVRGGMVTLVSQGASVSISLAATVILARLLNPDDYGLMSMVMALASFAGLFRDLGLSSAAIQKHTLTNAQQSNLFWINVTFGSALTLGFAAASPLVVWFYHKPELLWVTVALSFIFVIGSLSTQSGALLVREMRFGLQTVATISGTLVSVLISVVMAFHGFRYWSLVWGQLGGGLATTCLLLVFSPLRPGLPSRGTGVREMIKFGANVTAFDFFNYFHRNLDNILIGRFCGTEALGLYSRAYTLLMFPIGNIRGPITSVAFPAMSRLLNQPQLYRAYYMRIAGILALITMPLSAFLFLTAGPFIQIVLGPKWAGITTIFSILAAVSFVQPVITLWGVVVLSSGISRRYLHIGIFTAICSALGFLGGIHCGPVGVAAGYAVATYLTAYPTLAWAFRGTPLRFQDFISSILRPLVASVVAVSICLMASHWMNSGSSMIQIIKAACLFMTLYFGLFFVLPGGKEEMHQFVKLLLSLLPKRTPSAI